MRTFLTIAVAATLAITAIFSSPSLASTANTWHVQAGSVAFDASGPSAVGNRFYPEALSIHAGDSVVITPVGPHTVTFNRPPGPLFAIFGPINSSPTAGTISSPSVPVSSGFIGEAPGATYTLTFAGSLAPGRYMLICGLHLGMSETVDVLPSSQALPKTDAQYTTLAQKEIARDLARAADIAAEATENDEKEDTNQFVLVGAGNARVSNLRFFPAAVTIRVGESVTFLKTKDPTEPHTVTFGVEPPDPLAQLMPRGGPTYSGGDASSGFMSTAAQFAYFQLAGTPLPVALTSYRLTFTKAGDFEYICALHDGVGMRGIVHVSP
jgi:plastocyanin